MMSPTKVEALYTCCKHELLALAISVLGDRALAEDAVHTGVIKALDHLGPVLRHRAFLFRCVRNAAIDIKRRSVTARNAVHLQHNETTQSAIEPDPALDQAISSLNAAEQQTLILRLRAGMHFSEIAAVHGTNAHTERSRYQRAIQKLRDHLRIDHERNRTSA